MSRKSTRQHVACSAPYRSRRMIETIIVAIIRRGNGGSTAYEPALCRCELRKSHRSKQNQCFLSVPCFPFFNRFSDFGSAVGTFVDEVDRCHAPVRLDESDEHRPQPNAARANDGRAFQVVMLDVGGHEFSPSAGGGNPNPADRNAAQHARIINTIERRKNRPKIPGNCDIRVTVDC